MPLQVVSTVSPLSSQVLTFVAFSVALASVPPHDDDEVVDLVVVVVVHPYQPSSFSTPYAPQTLVFLALASCFRCSSFSCFNDRCRACFCTTTFFSTTLFSTTLGRRLPNRSSASFSEVTCCLGTRDLRVLGVFALMLMSYNILMSHISDSFPLFSPSNSRNNGCVRICLTLGLRFGSFARRDLTRFLILEL